jgi:hypothetical protein
VTCRLRKSKKKARRFSYVFLYFIFPDFQVVSSSPGFGLRMDSLMDSQPTKTLKLVSSGFPSKSRISRGGFPFFGFFNNHTGLFICEKPNNLVQLPFFLFHLSMIPDRFPNFPSFNSAGDNEEFGFHFLDCISTRMFRNVAQNGRSAIIKINRTCFDSRRGWK